MGIIYTEFDNTLEKSEIIMPLLSSSKAEAGEDYHDMHMTDKAQTMVFGIHTPIVVINNTNIDFGHVLHFKLSSKSVLPTLSLTVKDRYGIIKNIDRPTIDNEVRIQILPKFENAYKKINLTFYITSVRINGDQISLYCAYKLPKLVSSQFKSFGKLDTYSLFKTAAIETKLGFATNISKTLDNRYVYCNNKSILDMLNEEINYSDNTTHVLDWWIDYWDNINLVDIKDRYNTIDHDEDLQIWAAGQIYETIAGNEPTPELVPAVINDHPAFANSELYVSNHVIKTNPGINYGGTDKVYAIYNDSNVDYNDYLIQNSRHVKNDYFVNFEYIGENYGNYNYLWSKCIRHSLISNMNLETVTVTMNTPVLALMRGHKVNFIHYVNDENVENRIQALEETGLVSRKNMQSNINLNKYDVSSAVKLSNGNFIVDRSISAQYLINGVEIIYDNNKWKYILTLVKNLDSRVSLTD